MITEEKIKVFKRKLKGGEPEGELKELLHSEGYSKEDIDKVFAPHHYDMRSWYLAFSILIFIGGVIVFLKTGGLLLLIMSGLLLWAYFTEVKRLEKEKNNS